MAISKKKIAFFGIPALILLALTEMFTTINLISPAFIHNARYADLPLLKGQPKSENYEIAFIYDSYAATITYSPSGQFFMVSDYYYRKFDNNGHETFSIKIEEGTFAFPRAHYVITVDGIYDLSKDTVVKEAYVQTIKPPPGNMFKQGYWQDNFTALYNFADVVLYGQYDYNSGTSPVYFKTITGWSVLYSSDSNLEQMGLSSDRITIEGYPPKFEQMIYLKDSPADSYSNGTSHIRTALPEDDLTYPRGYGIKTLSFYKDHVLDQIVFTPIPVVFKGPAAYRIRVGEEMLYFSETAARFTISLPISRMHRFTLPDEYIEDTDVSFLDFKPLSNIDTSGSDGLYVIRKR